MKCFCCGKELNKSKYAWCPTCGLLIDVDNRQAGVHLDYIDNYVDESLECMKAIHKYKPDVVLAKWQLFSVGFKCSDVKFLYKNRKAKACCIAPTMYITRDNIVRSNYKNYLSEYPVLIAVNGVLSYKFRELLIRNYALIDNWKGAPTASLFNVSAFSMLYNIAGVLSIDLTVDTKYATDFVDVLTRWRLDKDDVLSDEAALLSYFSNGIREAVSNVEFGQSIGTPLLEVLKARLRNKDITPVSDNLINDSMRPLRDIYSSMRPCLCGTLYDPLLPRNFDNRYVNANNSSNSLLFTWWVFMSKLCGNYLPVVKESSESLHQIYKEFIAK